MNTKRLATVHLSEYDGPAPRCEADLPARVVRVQRAAQVNEKAFVAEHLRDLCAAIDTAPQSCGRPRIPLADAVFCATMKVYGGASGRRAMSDLREVRRARLHRQSALLQHVFCNALENPDLTPILRALVEESARSVRAVER